MAKAVQMVTATGPATGTSPAPTTSVDEETVPEVNAAVAFVVEADGGDRASNVSALGDTYPTTHPGHFGMRWSRSQKNMTDDTGVIKARCISVCAQCGIVFKLCLEKSCELDDVVCIGCDVRWCPAY